MLKQELIDLSLNENNYRIAPKITIALKNFKKLNLNKYKKESSLIEFLSKYHKVKKENLFIFSGSEEALIYLFAVIATKEKKNKVILLPEITWDYYYELAKRFKVKVKHFKLKKKNNAFLFDEQMIINSIKSTKPLAILIASPNNPTGGVLSKKQIKLILSTISSNQLLIIDEAYAGFSNQKNADRKIKLFPNLILIRSFSKYYGLAGLRIGYVIAGNKSIKLLKFRKQYLGNNCLAEAASIAALKSKQYYKSITNKIIMSRERLFKFFLKSKYFIPFKSHANFLLIKTRSAKNALLYSKFLFANKIKIKTYSKGKLKGFIRITIGTEKQISRLISLTKNFIKRC